MGLGFLNWGKQAAKQVLKKSDSTIKGVTPTLGHQKTRRFKINKGLKKLTENINKLADLKNK